MKTKKYIGYILILLPFVFLQYMSYHGSYLETGSWQETFSDAFSSLPFAIGYHLWIIVGIIIVLIIYKKNKNRI